MDIKFKVDGNTLLDTLTWEDMDALENRNPKTIRPIMAKFVVDEKGNPVELPEAIKMLGKVSLRDMEPTVSHFNKIFNDALLNPTTGDESNTPSPKVEAPQSGGSSSAVQEVGTANPGN